ncbi:MAG: alpha-L-fucosidase [Anaerolineae bacterium]
MGPAPTALQLRWQEKEFGLFFHFGINTFYGKEWSDGTLDPSGFDPKRLDARQWVETAQAAGAGYVVFTAKHHDGFCLWPTDTTDYSVRASPFRGGRGDVVAELATACREAGMPLGLYLSPWDRHEPCYADAAAYDRFYVRQLTELCSRYGPLFELWFDGAGSEGRHYDWDAIMAVVDRFQAQAMVFNMGRRTIRWVGNEDGLATDPDYYAVDAATGESAGIGSGRVDGLAYLPPECDVPIRGHWFWQPDDIATLKSVEHLLGIYYRSVGYGANLLLNVPPNRDGLIDERDRGRLLETVAEWRRRFATPIRGRLRREGDSVTVDFGRPIRFDHLVLAEDLTRGQNVSGYTVTRDGAPICAGCTIGHKKIDVFAAVTAERLRVTLKGPSPRLRSVIAYSTGQHSPAHHMHGAVICRLTYRMCAEL